MERRHSNAAGQVRGVSHLLPGLLGILLLVGCSEGESEVDTEPDSDTEAGFDMAVSSRYPADSEGDDPAGMIVTGLDELDASQTVSPWLVSIRQFRNTSTTATFSVELTRYAEDFPVSAHIRFFSESLDSCLIRDSLDEESLDLGNPPPGVIDGGTSVVFNTASGPQFSMPRTRLSDGQFMYGPQDELSGTLPDGATLSIPGGAFPTVAAYSVFEPEPVVRLLPDSSQLITAESDFSWIPLNQSDHVKIDFMAFDKSGEFLEYPVSCWVEDDGAFELPDLVVEALEPEESGDDSSVAIRVRYSRVYSRVDVKDGIVFHQVMEVTETEAM
ncbi:hypothetical protein [Granulosicoccus antarcticus]|uniref:Lipoprotein n=1 Tax=Granulosicoccus antarcticus IMCC3135 TaxID=1192854 RepID=A0A2Z2NMA4_9GAMM|nr:hypothetical protein [Granulosicoccus antarcticus]ASJ72319.1 hypothetical protein IMCC3135_11140 [Granulosicoccus antarcticus IMCC3135]